MPFLAPGTLIAATTALAIASPASALTTFTAVLEGSQEVPPVTTSASGTAVLSLNDTQDRLEISIQISGLDLDGNQTPGNDQDDVTLAHIHRAPAGVNGPIVFGFIGPNSDLNGDLVIDPAAGTIVSAWDSDEGEGTTLADELDNLFAQNLYVNIHTVAHGGGEIRGQVVPEPVTAVLLGLGLAGLASRAMRKHTDRDLET